MHLAKISVDDAEKLLKAVKDNCISHTMNVTLGDRQIKFSFEDRSHSIVTVTLFDESTAVRPTLTRTETIT